LDAGAIGQRPNVFSALVAIVASQVVLAGLLFGTAALDRGSLITLPSRRRRRRGGPIATVRAHQRQISSLRAASQRSLESLTADR
jgi:hypothetical protein